MNKHDVGHRRIYKILQKTKNGYKVIYIGQTSKSLEERFFEHCSNWLYPMTYNFNKKYIKIVCIQHCYGTFYDSSKIELKWINYYKNIFDILNYQSHEEKTFRMMIERKKIDNSLNKFLFFRKINLLETYSNFELLRPLSCSTAIPIKCLTTNEIFPSVMYAREKFHLVHLRLKHKTFGTLPNGTPLKWEKSSKNEFLSIMKEKDKVIKYFFSDSKKMFKVYKIIQKTKKGYKVIYVGMTSKKLISRFFEHIDRWFGRLVIEYGLENFRIVCITISSNEKIAYEKAYYWSKYYRIKFQLYNNLDGRKRVKF